MANNLFISYDLNSPGQGYDEVFNAIKSLGNWAKVQKSFWYVSSTYSAEQAAEIVWAKMDRNDSLIVIDASSNDASWYNLPREVSNYIQENWKHRVI